MVGARDVGNVTLRQYGSSVGPQVGFAHSLSRSFWSIFLALISFVVVSSPVVYFLWPTAVVYSTGMMGATALALCSMSLAVSFFLSGDLVRQICGMVLLSFTITYPVSAMAHLFRLTTGERGFWDLTSTTSLVNTDLAPPHFWWCFVMVLVALLALHLGLVRSIKSTRFRRPLSALHLRSLLFGGLVFLSLGIYANVSLFGSIQSVVTALRNVDRESDIESGLARYYFISRWMSWGVCFVLASCIAMGMERKWYFRGLLLASAIVVLGNTYWRGGRTEGILALLPTAFVVVRMNVRIGRGMLLSGLLLLCAYLFAVTMQRDIYGTATWLDVLDWHAGRFSMIDLGLEMKKQYGFMMGATLPAPILETLNAPSRLFGIEEPFHFRFGIVNWVGLFLRGKETVTGIVPGSIAELYFNFGVVGVAVGYFLIGRACGYFAELAVNGSSIGASGVGIYAIVLFCTSVIPGTCTTWIYHLCTMGFPVISLLVVEMSLPQLGQRT